MLGNWSLSNLRRNTHQKHGIKCLFIFQTLQTKRNIFTARQQSCGKVMFSVVSVHHSVRRWERRGQEGGPTWPVLMMHWTLPYSDLPTLPPDMFKTYSTRTSLYRPCPRTCSNLFIMKQVVGGLHSTGMVSCYKNGFIWSVHIKNVSFTCIISIVSQKENKCVWITNTLCMLYQAQEIRTVFEHFSQFWLCFCNGGLWQNTCIVGMINQKTNTCVSKIVGLL